MPQDDFVKDDFEPEMTFAIVNGVRVPLGGDTSDYPEISTKDDFVKDDFEPEIKEPERETPAALRLLERAMQPLVDISPLTRQHMAEFEQVHPFLGALGRNAVDFTLGESSPLGLGLGAIGAGESTALRMGFPRAAQLLKIPSRAAGAGLTYHGLEKIGNEETLGGKLGGGLEAVLGGLAARGPRGTLERATKTAQPNIEPSLGGDVFDTSLRPKRELEIPSAKVGTPPYNTSQFGLDLNYEDLPYPQNVVPNRLRAPSTNATVFDALLPESLKLNEQGAALPPTTSVKTTPRQSIPAVTLERPKPITIEDKTFAQKASNLYKRLITEESGEARFPNGKPRKPLRALDELQDALFEASGLRAEQEDLYTAERGKRFAKADVIKTQGKKGFYQRLGALKGEMPKVEWQPVQINADSSRALYNEIERSNLSRGDKTRASTGLGKVLGDYEYGKLPQPNEIEQLRRVFGDPIADQLLEFHSGVPLTINQLTDVINLSKSMMSAYDASAPFRQGLGLIHTKEFWSNYRQMYRYLGKDAYNVAMQSLHADPMFSALEKSGIRFTEIGAELGKREEQFMSKLAENIPGIPASERMYTGFLNKTRFDVAKRLMMEAEKEGLKPFTKSNTGELVPTALGREISQYVNNATGRGSLYALEKNAVGLNALLFSPRLISSRLTMLNPAYYIKATPFVRKQALKSLFAMATAGKIVEELGKAAGGTVDTSDKSSADYHKVRIGNTRVDPYGGHQQYITAASKLIGGAYNTYANEETQDVFGKAGNLRLNQAIERTLTGGRFPSFAENKLSPVAKFIDDIARGRPAEDTGIGSGLQMMGVEHNAMTSKVLNQFTPMILQDLLDVWKEDPSLIPLSLLSSQGMGVQTYGGDREETGAGFRQLVR